jgi:putative FmdB family regulatory protein
MPIYDYRCSDCGNTFETLVKKDTVPACPKCKSSHLEKLLSIPSPPVTHSAPEPACQPGGCGACRFN